MATSIINDLASNRCLPERRWALSAGCLFAAVMVGHSASAQNRVCWSDVHGRTSHSDGEGSLDDYFTWARDISKLDSVIV